ncbi:MAG: glycosyl transferase group 1 [Gemmatimonadetes bacterium]|nr:glycosyl transferase group 1 [Gemmatimonadota bacterium]
MKILMVTIGYPPQQTGGTEVYVAGLVGELERRGHECAIAYVEEVDDASAPPIGVGRRDTSSTPVHVVQVNRRSFRMERLSSNAPLRRGLLSAFREVVRVAAPDLVHVHPLRLGLESHVIEMLDVEGIPTVLTFHSSTTTCARGDLVHRGREVCDGVIRQARCTSCSIEAKGVSASVAAIAARVPVPVCRAVSAALAPFESIPLMRRARSAAAIPLTIVEQKRSWSRATEHAARVVAVCDWVGEVAAANGVPHDKLVKSRHGHRLAGDATTGPRFGRARFGYLGRISNEKGISVLVDALRQLPADLAFDFEFCSATFTSLTRRSEDAPLVEAIERLASDDARVRILDQVTDAELPSVLSRWDALVVPSLWLESGPQVIYEAFAVHTPVIGSRRGGIAELVADGRTGVLVEPGNASALASVLAEGAERPDRLRALRANITPVRTVSDVTDDMLATYRAVLGARETQLA